MPLSPPTICSSPGCSQLARKAQLCPTHGTRRSERSEATRQRDRFYSTARWLRFRAYYLAKHPLCVDCEEQGRVRAAKDVDHIVPRAQGGADLDENNVRGLCRPCHSRRTMKSMNEARRP